MDRKQKLYLICGVALILIAFVITALILSAQKRNSAIPETEEMPVITAAPTASPIATPTATPSAAPDIPEISTPVLPGETASPTSTPSPAATPAPTTVPSVSLPSGSSNPSTPATTTPKPSAVVVEITDFDFSIPARANTRAQVAVTVSDGTNVQSVTWAVSKSGFLGIQTYAGSDVTGTLSNTGGTLSFVSSGTYTVTATVRTTDGKTNTVSRSIEVKETDTFNFSMPSTAYTDTVVHVQMLNGSEAAAWEVFKDGVAVKLGDAFVGTLDKNGGYITFKNEGIYTFIGNAYGGKEVSVSIEVKKR